jgi:HPt (histidine-containing phosphotransfer) domain-containing protein
LQTSKPLLDITFGLSQLSGNAQLLNKMLLRFASEYRDSPQKVEALLESDDYNGAKMLIHTAKGITGNLGLVALFDHCKVLELHIKAQAVDAELVEHYRLLVEDTCAQIHVLDVDNTGAKPHQNTNANAQLVEMLKRQEFIDQSLVRKLVSDLHLSDSEKQTIIALIEALRYDQALSMLSR